MIYPSKDLNLQSTYDKLLKACTRNYHHQISNQSPNKFERSK